MSVRRVALVLVAFTIIVVALRYCTTPLYISNSEKYSPTEIVYKSADGGNLKLDVYFPPDTLKKHKTVIYFHGGSWISGNKTKVLERYRDYAVRTLLDNHIEVISADYRLINFRPEHHLQQCIADSRDAIRFVLDNADYLKVDTSQIGLWGSSAGSHIAMVIFGKRDDDADSIHQAIKFIINDFGPTDINTMWQRTPKWFRRMISMTFYDTESTDIRNFDSLSEAFSPNSYVKELREVPMLISQGSADRIVDPTNSSALHDSLQSTSVLFIYNGLPHGFKSMDSTGITLYSERLVEFVRE